MRSQFLSRLNPEDESFKTFRRDLGVILSQSIDAIQDVVAQQSEYDALPATSKQRERMVRDMCEQYKLTPLELNSCFSIISFFTSNYFGLSDNTTETAEGWARDLEELGALAGKPSTSPVEFAGVLLTHISGKKREHQRALYERGALPHFNSYAATVELRAVLDHRYGFDENVEKYIPSIVEYVRVATIKIGRSDDEAIHFQTTEIDLRRLIDSLTATLKEMKALRESS